MSLPRIDSGSHHRTPAAMLGFFVLSIYQSLFYMFSVYILYSASSGKTYVGFTKDFDRRVMEHNFTEEKGFTS
jgi:GIY-YIG catalytic domain